MLIRLLLRNVKQFEKADFECGKTTLFIGSTIAGRTAVITAVAEVVASQPVK